MQPPSPPLLPLGRAKKKEWWGWEFIDKTAIGGSFPIITVIFDDNYYIDQTIQSRYIWYRTWWRYQYLVKGKDYPSELFCFQMHVVTR